ncbi:MAG: methyltransferase domain-containing protein [Ruminococcaceae bacterium]|nr:methyltransferase domain-containing protein [Oscillospiraceae bacterium]
MINLICPVCGCELNKIGNSLKCDKNHSFDIARQGYVNLLMSNKSSLKHHGDDKLMVKARSDFFEKGYYAPLREGVISAVMKQAKKNVCVLDSGCGDCWYTEGVYKALGDAGMNPTVMGIDISKDALIAGRKQCRELTLCVASASKLPVKTESADIVLNIFSPLEADEYSRVLKKDGVLIRAVPMEKHLWSLKQAVYDKPYENPPVDTALNGFELVDTIEVRERIKLTSTEDIQNLFKMTPYYYKTGVKDQYKLTELDYLETELEVMILSYCPIK